MNEARNRHGCLTAFLALMVVVNSLSALMYIFARDDIARNLPEAPSWAFPLLAVVSLFNVACAVALFQWKKWGFYGFVATSSIAFVVNIIIGMNIFQTLLGLAGVAILYWVLQIGANNKGWQQLE